MAPHLAPGGTVAESHTQGSLVWVADAAESWVKAEVKKVEDGVVTVTTEAGKTVKCSPEDCPIQNPDQRGGVEVRTCRGEGLLAGHAWRVLGAHTCACMQAQPTTA